MDFLFAVVLGFVAGAITTYFVLRNPKNDKLKEKVDKVVDTGEKFLD